MIAARTRPGGRSTGLATPLAYAMRQGTRVFAWRDIRQGEEITIDYRLNAFTDERWECVCGSTNCQGYIIGSFFSLDEEAQRIYLPYLFTAPSKQAFRQGCDG